MDPRLQRRVVLQGHVLVADTAGAGADLGLKSGSAVRNCQPDIAADGLQADLRFRGVTQAQTEIAADCAACHA